MRVRLLAFLCCAACAAVAIAACSGSTGGAVPIGDDAATDGAEGGTDSGSGTTADQACTEYANEVCTRVGSCVPWFISYAYGDTATCNARQKLACSEALAAAGALRPDDTLACANAIAAQSCDDFFAHVIPTACSIHGTLAQGATCLIGSQCQGDQAYCQIATDNTCGACATRGGAGAQCAVNEDCQSGMVCAKSKCAAPGVASATCSDAVPCRASFACKAGSCQTPAKLGDTCTPTQGNPFADCDELAGLYCDPGTTQCKAIVMGKPGDTCGNTANGLVVCGASGACRPGGDGGANTGVCVAAAADGAACDSINGPTCTPPAQCKNQKCTLPDPTACK
jgi:hypothetical protein